MDFTLDEQQTALQDSVRKFAVAELPAVAKCFANEIAREVTGKALQLMGGYGYSTEFPMEQKMGGA